MMCKRCDQEPAKFVILTDLMRMPVCTMCAAESRKYLGLRVAVLVDSAGEIVPDYGRSDHGTEHNVKLGAEFRHAVMTPFQRILTTAVSKMIVFGLLFFLAGTAYAVPITGDFGIIGNWGTNPFGTNIRTTTGID